MAIDIQAIVAFGMLALVLVYVSNKYVVKPIRSKKTPHEGCGSECSCKH